MAQVQLSELLQIGIQISEQIQESPSRTECLSRGQGKLITTLRIYGIFVESCDQLSVSDKRKLGLLLFYAEVKKDVLVNFEVHSRRLRINDLVLGNPIRIFYGKEPKDRKKCPVFRADSFHLLIPEHYLQIEDKTCIPSRGDSSDVDSNTGSSNESPRESYSIQCRTESKRIILLYVKEKSIQTSKGKVCWIPHSGQKMSSRDHLI